MFPSLIGPVCLWSYFIWQMNKFPVQFPPCQRTEASFSLSEKTLLLSEAAAVCGAEMNLMKLQTETVSGEFTVSEQEKLHRSLLDQNMFFFSDGEKSWTHLWLVPRVDPLSLFLCRDGVITWWTDEWTRGWLNGCSSCLTCLSLSFLHLCLSTLHLEPAGVSRSNSLQSLDWNQFKLK